MADAASELAKSEFRMDETRPRPGTTVIAVWGEVDLHVAPDLRDRMTTMISDGTNELVVDLSDATFVDSMTLGVLLGAMKRLRARNGHLRVVVTKPDLRRIFEITLLDQVFALYSSLDDALAAGVGDR